MTQIILDGNLLLRGTMKVGQNVGDLYWNNVTALLHLEGDNGSTTITDSSPRASTNWGVAANGAISTAQAKFGTSAFRGTGDGPINNGEYIANATDIVISDYTSRATIELWVRYESWLDRNPLIHFGSFGSDSDRFQVDVRSNGTEISIFNNSGTNSLTTLTNQFSLNTWHNFTLVLDDGTYYLFVDGNLEDTGSTSGWTPINNDIRIGYARLGSASHGADAFFDEVRITDGIARYRENFTPSETAFSEQLLFSSSDIFFNEVHTLLTFNGTPGATAIGNSGLSGIDFTALDNAQLTNSQTNFYPTAVSFDGADDRVVSNEISTLWSAHRTRMTYEAWVYPVENGRVQYLFTNRNGTNTINRFSIEANTTQLVALAYWNGSNTLRYNQSTIPMTVNQWNHVAVVLNGRNVKIFINGDLGLNQSLPDRVTDIRDNLQIGYQQTDNFDFNGFMSEVRITNDVRYSSPFNAPATALPLSGPASSPDQFSGNVVSILNFGEMGDGTVITDTVKSLSWSSVGNAAVSGGEAQFDGDGDYLQATDVGDIRGVFNNSANVDWTLEFRWRPVAHANYILFDWAQIFGGAGMRITQPGSDPTKAKFFYGDVNATSWEVEITSTDNVLAGQENELAITKVGNDYLMHLNGVYQGKGTTSVIAQLGTEGMRFGEGRDVGAAAGFNGQLLRFRLTEYIARYQESVNYTPVSPFDRYPYS